MGNSLSTSAEDAARGEVKDLPVATSLPELAGATAAASGSEAGLEPEGGSDLQPAAGSLPFCTLASRSGQPKYEKRVLFDIARDGQDYLVPN